MGDASTIFVGFRALGFVTNHVPLAVRYHQKHRENYVVTCVGKVFHTYNCSRLGIVSVSNTHPNEITCQAVDAYLVYTACGKLIQAFERGRKVVHKYEGHHASVHLLLPFGGHLLSVDEDSKVKVWDVSSEELFLDLEFDNKSFQISSIVHPSTYVNKVLFGSQQGSLQLWNLRSNKQLYTFPGWGVAVTVLQQSPAVDVIAIGLADGQILLHNLKYDETVVKFLQDWGPVTTLAFRTDGPAVLASGSTLGHIALWDLEKKKLQSQMRDAHTSSVTGMHCLPNEPLLVTSSPDNSLKVWIFDQPDGGGRLLRDRQGHSAPPSRVRFYGTDGQTLLSAGQDSRLHSFSTVHDRLNRSLGRASYNKKKSRKSGLKADFLMMPPITDFVAEKSRQSDWDSITCIHRGVQHVTTWNYHHFTMGSYRLQHSDKEQEHAEAQCVDISSCGNFTVVGDGAGHLHKYNMQSGIHRGSYGKLVAHGSGIRGVVIDGLNQVVISGGADCAVHWWHFKDRHLLGTLTLSNPVSMFRLHRDSSMLAVAQDDYQIVIIDIDTCRVVRKFTGHSSSINDMTFSADGRWLITASMDATVRTWDLPTGRLVDCFVVDGAVTSLDMSPRSDLLVTTLIDDLGVYLWANSTLYTHVSLTPLSQDYTPKLMQLPSTSSKSQGLLDEEDVSAREEYLTSEFKSPEQMSNELVTLSLLPTSRWLNLLNLDIIKLRNKPRAAPKIPKSAPFFLPTIPGLTTKFAVIEDVTEKAEDTSKINIRSLQTKTPFAGLLHRASQSGNYEAVLECFKQMGPSAIDAEVRLLEPESGGSVQLMAAFLEFIHNVLNTCRDFELAQAYLAIFLKVHGETISSQPSLIKEIEKLSSCQQDSWTRLQNTFNQTLCLVNYLRSATL